MPILNIKDRVDAHTQKKEEILTLAQKLKTEIKKPVLLDESKEKRTSNIIKYIAQIQNEAVNLIRYEQRYL